MSRLPFLGPSAVARGFTWDNERTINLVLERKEAGNPKSDLYAYGAPCLLARYLLPAGPVRGQFYQDGVYLAVGGTSVCLLRPDFTYIVIGSVALDSNPVSFCCSGVGVNAQQIMLTSGGNGYVYTPETGAFVQITDPGFPTGTAAGCEFLKGRFIVRIAASNRFQYSDLLDALVWDGLSFFETSDTSDNKIGMLTNHADLWLWGTKRTEVWQATTDPATPYAPILGTPIEHGTIAGFSAARVDNTAFWMSGNENGARMVMRANGYNPERISNNPIDHYLNKLSRVDDALGFAYQQEGHEFYLLYIPSADTTLCYDANTHLWTERAQWSVALMRWFPMWARNHVVTQQGHHLVGDRQSGTIFSLELDRYADAKIVS